MAQQGQPQGNVPQRAPSLQQLTNFARNISQRTRNQREMVGVVNANAEIVKEHEGIILENLNQIVAHLGELSLASAESLNELRQYLLGINENTQIDLGAINQILTGAPTRQQIIEQLNAARQAISNLHRRNGVSEENANQTALRVIPQANVRNFQEPRNQQGPPAANEDEDEDEDEEEAPPPPRNYNDPPRGGRRPKRTKKRGGYGWSGKKGVEVRSSIRTTRRSKAKKGKKTPSKKRTKKRSSGNKRSMKSRRGGGEEKKILS